MGEEIIENNDPEKMSEVVNNYQHYKEILKKQNKNI